MKLIKKLETRRHENNSTARWGLFYCSYCKKETEKLYHNGLRNKSCGCMRSKLISKAETIHGCTRNGQLTRLYITWYSMKRRCYYKKHISYKYYGGRGITVCDEWLKSFISFRKWALNNGYKDDLEIDRENNNRNYAPDNCRWATEKEQNRNQRSTKLSMKKANQIRSLYFNIKISRELLGKIFNVSSGHIGDIVNGKTWA